MNDATNGTTTAKRRERLAITKRFILSDGSPVSALDKGSIPVALVFDFGNKGENIHKVTLQDFDSILPHLAIYGLRALLNAGMQGADNEQDAESQFLDKVESILEGDFSDRGGERGVNLDQFATVLAACTGKPKEEVKALFRAKEAALTDQDVKTHKNRKGEEYETDAFERWVDAVRSTNDYRAKASELFPRKRKESKQVTLDSLL